MELRSSVFISLNWMSLGSARIVAYKGMGSITQGNAVNTPYSVAWNDHIV